MREAKYGIAAALVLGLVLGFVAGRSGGGGADAVAGSLTEAEVGAAPAQTAAPAQGGGVSRTILMTVDDPAGPTHEVVMGVAEIAPGAASGRHDHPGIEVGYVLDGTLLLHHDGRESVTVAAGEGFHNDAPHDAVNAGDGPLRILAVWIVEKGEPMASPVP